MIYTSPFRLIRDGFVLYIKKLSGGNKYIQDEKTIVI